MENSEAVYFVQSSDEDEDGLLPLSFHAQYQESRSRAPLGVRADDAASSSEITVEKVTRQSLATMEDVLFELPSSFRSQRVQPASAAQSSTAAQEEPPTRVNEQAARVVAADTLSGQSPVCMPAPLLPPVPLQLSQLRGMTCAEVRDSLEVFYVRSEARHSQFRAAKTRVEKEDQATVVAELPAGTLPLRMRDRCARLVNISNWGAGEDSPDDVLLPATLVRSSTYYHPDAHRTRGTSGSAGAKVHGAPAARAADAPAAGGAPSTESAPRTLRPHQIDGVRFLWSRLVEAPVGRVPAVGCILAHTMGLGKTAQVVLFLHLFMAAYRRSPLSCPSAQTPLPRVLVVVPKSTVSVWQKEFESWSKYFPVAFRVRPTLLDGAGRADGVDGRGGGGSTAPPSQRVAVFRQWRREGGVFVIGYEALVRLAMLVEEDNQLSSTRPGQRYGAGGATPGVGSSTDRVLQSYLKDHKLRDEGGTALGGAEDPFTELVVCDEAHRLKSVHLQVVAALRGLHPLRRLLLTGTPLQNHLSEYWAMIDFAVHKYFDRHRFKDFFVRAIESSVHRMASAQEVALARKKTFTLINEVRHFVQRVDSTPLRAELPPLHEYVVVVPLSQLQCSIYCKFVSLLPSLCGEEGSRFQFLPAVSFAGKIACHPQLIFERKKRNAVAATRAIHSGARGAPRSAQPGGVSRRPAKRDRDEEASHSSSLSSTSDDEDAPSDGHHHGRVSFSQLYENSSDYDDLCDAPPGYVPVLEDGRKLLVAMKLIQSAIRKKEKTLLFSLSTKLLDFFECLIARANVGRNRTTDPVPVRYCRLDGSHSAAQRVTMLQEFNEPGGSLNLFLLSMKAGGVGVTITAATRVILLDTSFNPADDQQAIGRAYRYGQTKPVFVYRLLCYQTLEYSIFEQKLAKDWLFKTVVEETSMKRDGLSGMHLREIFALLGRAAKVLKRPARATDRQAVSTAALTAEDDVLRAVEKDILYAQKYEVFLSQDDNETYGEAEQSYYDRYRKERMFDVGGNVLSPQQLEQQVRQRAQLKDQQARRLQSNSHRLLDMVDELIGSRASTDPQLAHLLSVMGLHVDRSSGRVRTAATESQTRVGALPADSSDDDDVASGNEDAVADNSDDEELEILLNDSGVGRSSSTGSRSSSHRTRATAASGTRLSQPVLLTDDEDDDDKDDVREKEEERGDGEKRSNKQDKNAKSALREDSSRRNAAITAAAWAEASREPSERSRSQVGEEVTVNPARYSRYRPGNSANNAIDIDD